MKIDQKLSISCPCKNIEVERSKLGSKQCKRNICQYGNAYIMVLSGL